MPRALFDVNCVIALVDPNHVFHERIHAWWAKNLNQGWASCPLTENGVIRVMSQPSYSASHPLRVGDLVQTLRLFQDSTNHEFWPDAVSMLDEAIMDPRWLVGHRQITDAYLLALAVHHGGCLVTLDGQIPQAAIRDAEPSHLIVPP